MQNKSVDQIEELLTRRTDTILPSQAQLEKVLRSKKKLRLYMGFDPTKPDLHIGHLVGLLQMKLFQNLGHEVICLIGDFTAMIGDPTDKSAARPKLSRGEVEKNASSYKDQAGRILSFSGKNPAIMKFNSQWLDKLKLTDILELASNFTVQQLIERDMFQDRLKNTKPIFLHEFIYPLMVTQDAIVMNVDLEIGGRDQLFNMSMGRNLIKNINHKDKFVMTTKLLTDSEGNKIGKTTGNAINLFGDPSNLFGQIMAFPDDVIIPAFKLITEVSLGEITSFETRLAKEAMVIKKRLALEVVKICQGEQAAEMAQTYFETTVQQKQAPKDIDEVKINSGDHTLLAICQSAHLDTSSAQIKRTIEQGGVEWEGKKITNPLQLIEVSGDHILKFGKRNYKKIVAL